MSDWQAFTPRPALVCVFADCSSEERVPVVALVVERQESGRFEAVPLILDEQRERIVPARERERRDGLGRKLLGVFERRDSKSIERAVVLFQARGGAR